VVTKNLAPPDTSFESLVNNQSVVAAVHGEILAVGKHAGLAGVELIQGLVLVPEEWSPENVSRLLSMRC
jgi:long-chain acyl-CoA synthetase